MLLLLKDHMVTTYITNLCPVPQAVGSIWPFFRYIWPQWPNFQHTTFLWLCVLHSKDPKRPDRPCYLLRFLQTGLAHCGHSPDWIPSTFWYLDKYIIWEKTFDFCKVAILHYLRENKVQSGNPRKAAPFHKLLTLEPPTLGQKIYFHSLLGSVKLKWNSVFHSVFVFVCICHWTFTAHTPNGIMHNITLAPLCS